MDSILPVEEVEVGNVGGGVKDHGTRLEVRDRVLV